MKADQIVSYDTAVLAKEKSFNEECQDYYNKGKELDAFIYFEGDGTGHDKNSTCVANDYYDNDILCMAPTQSLLQKWLREKHKVDICIKAYYNNENGTRYDFYINLKFYRREYTKYEEALEEALTEALKELK